MTDYRAFIADHFDIVDKQAARVPFVLNPCQEVLSNCAAPRVIVLKPRQIGSTAYYAAEHATDFILEDNHRSVIVAHEASITAKLLDRVKFYLKCFEEKTGTSIPLKYNSRNELTRLDNNNTLYIGTAGASSFGRGDTIHKLLASEVAYYEQPDVMVGLLQAVPKDGRVVIESTANGYGNYYQVMWDRANRPEDPNPETGWNGFTPIFLDYTMMPEYQAEGWREAKLREFADPRLFTQEFPASPEEAFLSSGSPFFDIEALTRMMERDVPPVTQGSLSMEGVWL